MRLIWRWVTKIKAEDKKRVPIRLSCFLRQCNSCWHLVNLRADQLYVVFISILNRTWTACWAEFIQKSASFFAVVYVLLSPCSQNHSKNQNDKTWLWGPYTSLRIALLVKCIWTGNPCFICYCIPNVMTKNVSDLTVKQHTKIQYFLKLRCKRSRNEET